MQRLLLSRRRHPHEGRGSETLTGTELCPILLPNKCLLTAELCLAVNYHLCQGQQHNILLHVTRVHWITGRSSHRKEVHWEHYARAACQRMEDPPAGKKCTGSITEEQLVKEWMILLQGRSALRALRKSSLSKNRRSSRREEVHWEHYRRAACQRKNDPPAGKKCTGSIMQEQLVKERMILLQGRSAHWEHYARAACQRMEDPPAGKKCTGSITARAACQRMDDPPAGKKCTKSITQEQLVKEWKILPQGRFKKCTKSITQEQLVKELAIKTHFAFPFTFGHALTMLAQSGRALELVIRAGLEELSLSFFPAIKPSEGNMGQGVCMADHPIRWRRISACKVHRPHCRRTSKPKHES